MLQCILQCSLALLWILVVGCCLRRWLLAPTELQAAIDAAEDAAVGPVMAQQVIAWCSHCCQLLPAPSRGVGVADFGSTHCGTCATPLARAPCFVVYVLLLRMLLLLLLLLLQPLLPLLLLLLLPLLLLV